MNRRQAERGGRRAERLAAWWLRLKGWRILAMRARTPVGEVDLVARRGRVLAFVEVKARATAAEAAIALDDYRLRRVARAAEALMPATCATATSCASTRCSSRRGDFPITASTSSEAESARRRGDLAGRIPRPPASAAECETAPSRS